MERVEYEKKLIQSFIASVEQNGGRGYLSSMILTGSFGREEPTYIIDSEGVLQLKSDVEIILVFPKIFQKNVVNKIITNVSYEFQEDLNLMAINERRVRKAHNFNFSLKEPKYKTLFTYDLFNGSKTIWGEDFISESHITLDDIDVYEAKRIVANRIGELIYLQNTVIDIQKEYLRKQWKGKLILAIVSAWLICEKKYSSSYLKQYECIMKNRQAVENIFGESFVIDYQRVFVFLRKCGMEYEVGDGKLQAYVRQVNQYLKFQNIEKSKVNSFSRKIKYFLKYIKTGMKYGILSFEDDILQTLICEYGENNENIKTTADVWHRVLY